MSSLWGAFFMCSEIALMIEDWNPATTSGLQQSRTHSPVELKSKLQKSRNSFLFKKVIVSIGFEDGK